MKNVVLLGSTGSIGTSAAAPTLASANLPKQQDRPAVVTGWIIRDVFDGRAMLENERLGFYEVVPGADLSRTVGWFTSMYPVRLVPGAAVPGNGRIYGQELGRALGRVKEQLRAIPDKGIGFGLLRYLNPETSEALAAAPPRHIGFNYFGRFLLPPAAGERDWAPAPETAMSAGADAERSSTP